MENDKKNKHKEITEERLSMPRGWGHVEQAPLVERFISDTIGYLSPSGVIHYATGLNPEQYVKPYGRKHYDTAEPVAITDRSTDYKAKLYKKIVEDLKKTSDGQLDDLAVRLGGTNICSDLGRTLLNRRTSLLGKMLSLPGILGNSFSANLTRNDHYNPFAHSVTVYSDNPAILTHELGHAINMNVGKRPRYKNIKDRIITDLKNISMDAYRGHKLITQLIVPEPVTKHAIDSIATFGIEGAANVRSNQAINKLKNNTIKDILLEERQRTLPAALSTYATDPITPVIGATASLPAVIGGILAGKAYGRIRSNDSRSMRELNKELRKMYGIEEPAGEAQEKPDKKTDTNKKNKPVPAYA